MKSQKLLSPVQCYQDFKIQYMCRTSAQLDQTLIGILNKKLPEQGFYARVESLCVHYLKKKSRILGSQIRKTNEVIDNKHQANDVFMQRHSVELLPVLSKLSPDALNSYVIFSLFRNTLLHCDIEIFKQIFNFLSHTKMDFQYPLYEQLIEYSESDRDFSQNAQKIDCMLNVYGVSFRQCSHRIQGSSDMYDHLFSYDGSDIPLYRLLLQLCIQYNSEGPELEQKKKDYHFKIWELIYPHLRENEKTIFFEQICYQNKNIQYNMYNHLLPLLDILNIQEKLDTQIEQSYLCQTVPQSISNPAKKRHKI